MSHLLIVQPSALEDAWEAAFYLEHREPALGGRFLDELERCYQYIRDFPSGFQQRRGGFRHAPVAKFPYRVVYEIDGGTIMSIKCAIPAASPASASGPNPF
ncbi:MAG: type II toxin-antitoxin system RelE/ParE family toxin [Flavobacteriales bacterium]|nr:type II toxin-antitoxin system RelE/ParE family toxin [Flavobacteriales bacterium]